MHKTCIYLGDSMLKKIVVGLFMLFVCALLFLSSSIGQNSQPQNTKQAVGSYEPKIIVSDHEKIILEFELPPLDIRDANIRGLRSQLINLVGYSQTADPGKPQVPLRGFSVGVPENARPSIQILEQESATRTIAGLPPAPRIRYTRNERPGEDWGVGDIESDFVYERDETIYGKNSFYPQHVARLGKDGIMRGQRIQTFQVFPIQYNPVSNQIKYCKRLRIAVYYNGSGLQKTGVVESAPEAFENIFKSTLLNYKVARDWRIGRHGLQKAAADDYFLSQGSEWCKLYLDTPGIYIVEKADLDAAGFDISGANVDHIKMFNKGVEIAIRVDDGNSNGVFEDGDYVEFYGTAFKNYYTDTNVYWLTVGTSSGKRMVVKDGTPGPDPLPVLIRGKALIHYEIDKSRKADFPDHESNEKWFTDFLYVPYANSRTFLVNITNLSDTSTTDCELKIKLQGASAVSNINPDHRSIFNINGSEVLFAEWDGQIPYRELVNFDIAHLTTGENEVEFASTEISGVSADWHYLDYFEIKYWRDYVAINDSLAFSSDNSGDYKFRLSGFVESDLWLYDISDSNNVSLLNGFTRSDDNVFFQDNLDGDNRFVALSQLKKRQIDRIKKYDGQDLRNSSNQSDYIIIAFADFVEALQILGDFYSEKGLNAKIVTTEEIYDNFGFGFYNDQPIKDFLSHAYSNWSGSVPTYVLLIGDASWNPRILNPDTYGAERSDFVPTHLFEAVEDNFEAASDNWFGSVHGEDVLPEFLIGRFTARSAAEASVTAQKVLNYATDFQAGEWNRTATFVADNDEGGVMAFPDTSDALIEDLVPNHFNKKRVYLDNLGTSGTQAAIKDAFNDGTLILNYLGHGSIGTWAAEKIFVKEDVPDLRNDNTAPYLLTLSCINGYFLEPKDENHSLAEALLRERQRGAVTVFSGSGEAYPSPVIAMGRKIYSTLFQEHNTTVGSFSNAGLIEMYARYPDLLDHVMFYHLFGDPATELHYQPAINYASSTYSGSVTINGAPADHGTHLMAIIHDQIVAKYTLSQTDGAFGPFAIAADNPATPQKEGGAPGDTVSFQAVTASTDTVQLYPYALWQGGEEQKLTLSDVKTSVANDLEFEFFVDNNKVGEGFFEHDPVSQDAVFSARITASGQIDASMLQLELNEQVVDPGQYKLVPDKKDPIAAVLLTYQPQSLKDGPYELKIRAIASTGISEVSEASLAFRVQSALSLDRVVNFPNPMTDASRFTFMLQNDKSALVQIKIYTVAGRLIRLIDAGYMSVGYNETDVWDGTDEYGEKLANGTYFYKIIADDGEEKAEVVEKLVVMR